MSHLIGVRLEASARIEYEHLYYQFKAVNAVRATKQRRLEMFRELFASTLTLIRLLSDVSSLDLGVDIALKNIKRLHENIADEIISLERNIREDVENHES